MSSIHHISPADEKRWHCCASIRPDIAASSADAKADLAVLIPNVEAPVAEMHQGRPG